MLRIANIIEDGRYAGPQKRIVEVARRLYEHNIETTVLYPIYDSDRFQQHLDSSGIKNIKLPIHRLTKEKDNLIKYTIFFLYEVFLIYRLLREVKFDAIHVSGGCWQVKGVIAGKLSKTKVLWHLNDTQMPRLIQYLFSLIARISADALIVAGNRVKDYYIGSGFLNNKRIFHIQAPVDCSVYDCKKYAFNGRLAKNKPITILTVANINPIKGLETFIEMAHLLTKRFDNLQFLIVGPLYDSQRQYFDDLQKLVKGLRMNNLRFCGPITNVERILHSADIYVCSSVSEASPMSVWEAMAMRKAIVSTDVGDVAEYIKDGKSGFVVPIRNAGALAEKVELFIENMTLRFECGKEARRTAEEYLDISICVKKHLLAYKRICLAR